MMKTFLLELLLFAFPEAPGPVVSEILAGVGLCAGVVGVELGERDLVAPQRDEAVDRPRPALVERRVGAFRLFVNGENLSNVRQSRWDPILRPDRAADGRWTVDSWASVDDRVIDGGIRVQF